MIPDIFIRLGSCIDYAIDLNETSFEVIHNNPPELGILNELDTLNLKIKNYITEMVIPGKDPEPVPTLVTPNAFDTVKSRVEKAKYTKAQFEKSLCYWELEAAKKCETEYLARLNQVYLTLKQTNPTIRKVDLFCTISLLPYNKIPHAEQLILFTQSVIDAEQKLTGFIECSERIPAFVPPKPQKSVQNET